MLKLALTSAALLATFSAHAKSAIELFEAVSDSLVVVHAKDKQGKAQSQGSGVVIAPGEVVTNCHVLENASTFSVSHRTREHPATRKHSDPDRDVCSLTVPGLNAPAAQLGSTRPLKVGQRVYAIGAAQGLELTLSEGILSSLREVEGGRYLQITTPISPGSSGGGLFDEQGRLIGLPTFYLAEGQQLNFAVPVEWIKELPKRHPAPQKAKPSSAQSSLGWLNKAIELQEKQDWKGLLRHAQAWTRAQPGDAAAWFALGTAYGYTGQRPQAIEAYQKALRINPEDADAWNNLGAAYYVTGQTAQAIEAYRQALRIDPEYAKAWYNLGIAYDDAGQRPQAIEAYQKALRIDPELAQAWNNLGAAYGKAGQRPQAIEAYRQAVRINPELAQAWNNLGAAYDKAGQRPQGIEAFRQALRIDPEYAEAWYNLGVAYLKAGQTDQAIEAYRQAVRINPELAQAWNNLGIAYRRAGQTDQAIEAYRQALRIDPEDAEVWNNLGVAYSKAGQTAKVMEVYRRLKGLDSELAERFFSRIVLP